MPRIPSRLTQRLSRRAEARLQRFQGKGYGGATIADEVAAAAPYIPQGATVLDIGANQGLWTRALLRQCPDVAAVYAFEPSRHNWRAIEAIGDARVHLVAAAVSNRAGSATLHSCAPGSPLASLALRRLDHVGIAFNEEETVTAVTLDGFIAEHGIENVAFAKLDIEGYELMALEGASSALRDHRIRALAFEFGGTNIDTRTYFRDFWHLLTGAGYRLFRIAPGGRLWPITAYSESLECFLLSNYLAVAAEVQAPGLQ
jgi:FkbM family methyltransferase